MVEPLKKRKSKTKKQKDSESNNQAPAEKKAVDPELSLKFDEVNRIIDLHLKDKKYTFDLNQKWVYEEFQKNVKLTTILNNLDYFKTILTNKENSLFPEITKITHHQHYTALECFFDHMSVLLQTKQSKNDEDAMKIEELDFKDVDKCCICLCDLYDGILNYDVDKLLEQMKIGSDEDVVKLDLCQGHFFHKSCLLQYVKDQEYIKCPICYVIYGEMIGLFI